MKISGFILFACLYNIAMAQGPNFEMCSTILKSCICRLNDYTLYHSYYEIQNNECKVFLSGGATYRIFVCSNDGVNEQVSISLYERRKKLISNANNTTYLDYYGSHKGFYTLRFQYQDNINNNDIKICIVTVLK